MHRMMQCLLSGWRQLLSWVVLLGMFGEGFRMQWTQEYIDELYCRLDDAISVIAELVEMLSSQDDEGLIEHAEPMMKARALLAMGKKR